MYGIFGFNLTMALSTRPEKYLGDLPTWDKAEKVRPGCRAAVATPSRGSVAGRRRKAADLVCQTKDAPLTWGTRTPAGGPWGGRAGAQQLADALNASGFQWKLNPGDGAFYGPKVRCSGWARVEAHDADGGVLEPDSGAGACRVRSTLPFRMLCAGGISVRRSSSTSNCRSALSSSSKGKAPGLAVMEALTLC